MNMNLAYLQLNCVADTFCLHTHLAFDAGIRACRKTCIESFSNSWQANNLVKNLNKSWSLEYSETTTEVRCNDDDFHLKGKKLPLKLISYQYFA